ncbi:LEA type 2 family protein [Pseudomonas fuscovaginae UPB0736]|uniref:LEA14-like dessication related protein n=1 Tax=Pseudomonas asplenii TaxID=53407 RepID=A0A1H6MXH3_9PSED|nr:MULTISPECIES: LEA type 2 family protein [Pseudomonas]UUQ63444.1 LEA type 2 family protein [Pseudomonas fuscovaginae UPB0736]UZE28058.1 LEA type 2 family protein [Pseudomonas asplenii]SDS76239.1 LEA14-like dessication related protein [Pseudomonas asplenii]SEI06874.1 LEA14-like dessication related protein [Pseudomonas fuscovaginae]
MRSRILGTLTLLVILALSGCASWLDAGPQDPVVSLVRVELVKAGLLQQKFKLHFRLDNPNDNTLTVRALHYRIYLDQWLLAEGESDQWLTVEPNSRMFFVVPVRTNLWQHVKPLAKRLEKPGRPIPYRLEGTLETGLFIGYDVHLEHKGEIIPRNLISE